MKTNVPSALSFFLDGICQGTLDAQFYLVDLVTFSLLNGVVLRLTTAETDITYNGNTYSSMGPYLNRTKVKQGVGLSVDEIKIDLYSDGSNQVYAQPILAAIAAGMFDQALVTVDRLYMQTPTDLTLGTIIWFVGQVSEIPEIGRSHAQLLVRDKRELLNTNLPRNLYQPGCRWVLGDTGCTVNLANYTSSGTVSAGSTVSVIQTNLTEPGPLAAPSTPPTLTDVELNSQTDLTPATYYVVYTLVNALGESMPSPEASHYISNNQHILKVGPLSLPTGCTANIYVAYVAGQEVLQVSGIANGDTWSMPGGGIYTGTAQPPQIPLSGYFSQGRITFLTGQNAGTSRFISQYGVSATGAVTVLPPLPYAPASGDTFQAVAGCDHSMSTCTYKFEPGTGSSFPSGTGNLINFGGFPFVPAPEMGSA